MHESLNDLLFFLEALLECFVVLSSCLVICFLFSAMLPYGSRVREATVDHRYLLTLEDEPKRT